MGWRRHSQGIGDEEGVRYQFLGRFLAERRREVNIGQVGPSFYISPRKDAFSNAV